MQKSFFNKKLVIVLIALIISFLLIAFSIAVRNNRKAPTFVQQIGNDAAGIVDRVVSYPLDGAKNATSSFFNLMNTYQENQQLKRQVDSLAAKDAENQTLRKENQQLKAQLKLSKSLTNYDQVTAYVLTRTPSTWQNQVTINKGSLAGIKKGDSVLSRKGIVGRITEVNNSNSKVELISTNNDSANRFAVQVTSKSGDVINGLITNYDTNSGDLVMGQVTSKKKIEKGTKVVTSGMGGSTPKGLLVGTVEKVSDDDYGLPSKIYIKPAADLDDLSFVTIAVRTDD